MGPMPRQHSGLGRRKLADASQTSSQDSTQPLPLNINPGSMFRSSSFADSGFDRHPFKLPGAQQATSQARYSPVCIEHGGDVLVGLPCVES